MVLKGKGSSWLSTLLVALMGVCVALTLGLAGCGNSTPEPPEEPVETPEEPQGSIYDEACTDENGIPTAYAFYNLTGEEFLDLLHENGFEYARTGNSHGWVRDAGDTVIVVGDLDGTYTEEQLAEMPRFGKGTPTIYVVLTSEYNTTDGIITGLAGIEIEDSASTSDGSYSLGRLDGNILVEGEVRENGYMFTVYNKDAIKAGWYMGGVYGTSVSTIWNEVVESDSVDEEQPAEEETGDREFAEECLDDHGTPTVYAFCELRGWQMQALLEQEGWTVQTSGENSAYMSADGNSLVMFMKDAEHTYTMDEVAELEKGGEGVPFALLMSISGYESIDDVMDVFQCTVLDSHTEGGSMMAVAQGPSMRQVLVAAQIQDDGSVYLFFYNQEYIAGGYAADGAYGNSIPEVWENVVGQPLNQG